MIYKRFNRKKWLDPLLTYFRPSRAWQAWQAGQHLLSRAVPTPQEPGVHRPQAVVPRRPAVLVPAARDVPDHPQGRAVGHALRLRPPRSSPCLDPAARRERIVRITLALARLLRTCTSGRSRTAT